MNSFFIFYKSKIRFFFLQLNTASLIFWVWHLLGSYMLPRIPHIFPEHRGRTINRAVGKAHRALVLLQFRLESLPEWNRAEMLSKYVTSIHEVIKAERIRTTAVLRNRGVAFWVWLQQKTTPSDWTGGLGDEDPSSKASAKAGGNHLPSSPYTGGPDARFAHLKASVFWK